MSMELCVLDQVAGSPTELSSDEIAWDVAGNKRHCICIETAPECDSGDAYYLVSSLGGFFNGLLALDARRPNWPVILFLVACSAGG